MFRHICLDIFDCWMINKLTGNQKETKKRSNNIGILLQHWINQRKISIYNFIPALYCCWNKIIQIFDILQTHTLLKLVCGPFHSIFSKFNNLFHVNSNVYHVELLEIVSYLFHGDNSLILNPIAFLNEFIQLITLPKVMNKNISKKFYTVQAKIQDENTIITSNREKFQIEETSAKTEYFKQHRGK